MPQHQDDQQYPGQQPGPGPGSPPISRSSRGSERGRQLPPHSQGVYPPQQGLARSAGAYPPQQAAPDAGAYFPQPVPSPAVPPPQRPQEQLVLSGQPRAERVEQPVEAGQVVRSAHHPQGAAMLRSSQGQDEAWTMVDYALVAGVVFLLIAVIVMFFTVQSIVGGQVDGSKILRGILIGAVLYAGCVGAGYLWGRYQSETEAKRNNEALRQENDWLRAELDRAKGEVRVLRTAAAAANNPGQPNARDYSSPRTPAIVAPRQIDQQQPSARIYDLERDPEGYSEQDRQDYPHEKVFQSDGNALRLASGWQIIGASRRGYAHSYEGKYREDDFNIMHYQPGGQDIALVAIADGVSSKEVSRFGARAAILGATLNYDRRLTDILAKALNKRAAPQEYESMARDILFNAMHSARRGVEQQARMLGLSPDELQSTLMVFLAAPLAQRQLLFASVQAGDGAIFALQPERGTTSRDQWSCLQRPQIQQFGNEVLPFMNTSSEMWEQYMRVDVLENPAFIMGMTDGTADDIEPPPRTTQSLEPDPFVFVDDFYKNIQTSALGNGQAAVGLLKFLSYKRKGSFDDRTVVCLYR